jgi:hypothetical protein
MPRSFAVSEIHRQGAQVGTWSAGTNGASPPEPPEVPPGSCLVAVVNNGEWQSAVDVTYPDYYARIRRRCEEGVWRAMSLYLLEEERAAGLEDGRRYLMDGTPVRDPGRALR